MPVKIDQETTDGLVADAFAAHSLCGCKDATHPLAAAAHAIIVHEAAPHKAEYIWDAWVRPSITVSLQGVTRERHAQSALWRALHSAKKQGRCSLGLISE